MHLRKLSAVVCMVITLMGSVPAWSEVIMGVFPRRPIANTYTSFKPLADILTQTLGEKVTLVIPKNFHEFWKGVKTKRFDLVHYNQYHYIKSHSLFGYKVIATNEEFGAKTIRSQIFVRKDSGYDSIADLKGKTILFGGGPKAMVCYIGPTYLLKKAGLEAGKDYKVRFAKSPPGAVIATYLKVTDASGCGDMIVKVNRSFKSKIDSNQLKAIATTEPYVHLTWAVKDTFSKAKAKIIQDVMTNLFKTTNGLSILNAAHVTNFHKASDRDFDIVRELTKFATGESL